MPRTAAKKGSEDKREPIDIYNSLDPHKQLVCHRYFSWIDTQGKEGWNPRDAGSVFHYRSSQYLIHKFSQSSFRHCGKQMVTLAERLAQLQTPPTCPATPTDQFFPAPILPPSSVLPTMPTLSSPSPGTPVQNFRAAASTPGESTRGDRGGSRSESSMPQLSNPTSYGRYRHFNYTTRRSSERMMVRMLLHGAVTPRDVFFNWISPKVLEVKVAWPQWFVFAEQMAALTADEAGVVQFPPEHQMTMDMSERNAELMGEDNHVFDIGYFEFDNSMIEEVDTFELLDIPIPDSGVTVKMLQFYVEAEDTSGTPARQRGITHTRTVNLGTGRTDEGPSGGRTAYKREEEYQGAATDEQGNVAMGGATANKRNDRTRTSKSGGPSSAQNKKD